MLPRAFIEDGRVIPALNVLAVSSALTAVAVTLLRVGLQTSVAGAVGPLPVFLVCAACSLLLRARPSTGKPALRWGWIAIVPLVAWAWTIAFACVEQTRPWPGRGLAGSLVVGAVEGAVWWVPLLIGLFVFFGLPIARAQRLAKLGLSGEERGERLVGLLAALVGCTVATTRLTMTTAEVGLSDFDFTLLVLGPGVMSALLGLPAALLANGRERRRAAFVTDAEAGRVPGYRVDPTPAGKVLVRVLPLGEGYRIADQHEPLIDMTPSGEVVGHAR